MKLTRSFKVGLQGWWTGVREQGCHTGPVFQGCQVGLRFQGWQNSIVFHGSLLQGGQVGAELGHEGVEGQVQLRQFLLAPRQTL